MLSILKKEINSFFSTPIGYLVLGVFFVLNGLFLWIFDNQFNILNAGFADLNSFFFLAPWIFIFLISAVTMKSFSDELSTGTFEILKTRPIGLNNIILGKYLAGIALIVLAIIPTLTYVYTISALGNPKGNFDSGSLIGSYLGLLLLVLTYCSIGIFSSTLSKNQIVAFITSTLLCLFLFLGFDFMSSLFGSDAYFIENLGLNQHYKSISRGVFDSRDFIYFISISFFFLVLTKFRLDRE